MILANKFDWFRTISLAKQSKYGGGLSSLGDYQKWFCYGKISWSNESEIDPGKLLGPEGYLFRANMFISSTTTV